MKNVQTAHMKMMKMYGTAGLFTVMTIVILKYFETQSQKKFSFQYFERESNCCCSDDRAVYLPPCKNKNYSDVIGREKNIVKYKILFAQKQLQIKSPIFFVNRINSESNANRMRIESIPNRMRIKFLFAKCESSFFLTLYQFRIN